ncbi:MAG: hypothetical protein GY787_24905 [Alteromonadales bacterium]|nr:hypothetical protein [Alteromonadales bacterium]
MGKNFEVNKCIECPAIKGDANVSEAGQVICSILGELVFAEVMATNCPFVSGERHNYKKQRRVGG